MAVRDTVRTKAANRGWTYVANGLLDTYSRPVTGWTSSIAPKGYPAWDEIANWKPKEVIQVLYDTSGDPVSAQITSGNPTALGQGRWVGVLEEALGTKTQRTTKVNAWLDKQAT